MTAKDYVRYLLSIESYSFSLDEIKEKTSGEGTSLKFELARLIEKKEILNLRKGYYLIIPPRYSRQGQPPVQLYIDKLFRHLSRNYYLGFYSAARFHGAGHQQSQADYVMTEKPMLGDISKRALRIRFLTTSIWPENGILEKRSDAGIFLISSPVLTMADLIQHQSKLGGINRMLAILQELSEVVTMEDLKGLLNWYPNKSTLQRLGFLLDLFDPGGSLTEPIINYLSSVRFFPVLLSPVPGKKAGTVSNRWKVDINVKLESDL